MVTSQTRNRSEWLSIAAFVAPLQAQALRAFARRVGAAAAAAQAAPQAERGAALAAAQAAPLQPHPDGNHGENLNEAQA